MLGMRGALFVSALLIVSGCRAAAPGVQPDPQVLSSRGALDPEMVPALEALHRAVMAGEDESARHILERLLARTPSGATLELARAFERILDGRALVGSIDLRLVAEEVEGTAGSYDVVLVGSQATTEPVLLMPHGARLREMMVSVDRDGAESRRVSVTVIEGVDRLALPVGEQVRLHLATVRLAAPTGSLAIRGRWSLELWTVEARLGASDLPAAGVRVAAAERVRLAAFLSPDPVQPTELLRYLREERVNGPALMERAVRILPERRAETLDLLSPMVEEMSVLTLGLLVGPLRWLAGTSVPGGDAEAWRRWLVARSRAGSPGGEARGLVLPGTRR